MEATLRNLQDQPKILKKIIGTPNQPISVKEPKICKGAPKSQIHTHEGAKITRIM
jgi:hypothetical protein